MVKSSLTTIELSSKNLIHNLTQFKKRIGPKIKLMAMVKADAYGHGLEQIALIVAKQADWLGVNSLEEGIKIRELKIDKPVLVLGYIPLSHLKEAIIHDLSFVAYNQETITQANQAAKKLKKQAKVHLKVETGTNRQGIRLEKLLAFAKTCQKLPGIEIEGAYTHFANIEDTIDSSFAFEQLKSFKKAIVILRQAKIKPRYTHTACTAATILFEETFSNLVRVGIGIYGLWPSKETKLSAKMTKKNQFDLRPVLVWKTKIAQIKTVPQGETIGYGRSFKTTRDSQIAIIPVGYWDGYNRKLSNNGRVLIRGQFVPVVGRICMNMFMVDVTDICEVRIEDEVVLLGKQGKSEITAEELAQKIGTINYEVISRIHANLPRRVIKT